MEATPIQGFPYPAGLDAANGARQIQDLAEVFEGEFNAMDAGWARRLNPPSWLVRTTSNQGIISLVLDDDGIPFPTQTQQWQSVDWDSGPLYAPINSGSAFTGLLAQGTDYETWNIGAYVMISGTTTLNAQLAIRIKVSEIDPLTNVLTTTFAQKTSRVTNNAGDHLNIDATFRVRNAWVNLMVGADGSGTKVVQAPSLMWATRVGVGI